MNDELKQKIASYADNAYAAASHDINQKTRLDIAQVKEGLASKGLAVSSVMVREMARVQAKRVNAVVQAKADSLLDAYELYGAEFDGSILEEAATLRSSLISQTCNNPSFVLPTGTSQFFSSLLNTNTDAILKTIACQIEQRKVMPKFKKPESYATISPISGRVDEDRRFALMAIDEARKSIPEGDNKPHPKVGAVVVKNGKVLSTAHRGEVPGNHAEFTVLERNLPDAAVAGATVYTTLEPCTTRNSPKIPCVDRLIDRRVARVVIGILDPDERITGKGQRKLSNAGIETSLFPHDLAMEVEELNREFTRYCEQKRQTAPVQSTRARPTSTPILKAHFIRSHLMPRSPWQSFVEGVFKAVGRMEYEVECDFLYEIFLVNTSENQVTVRNFIAEVQIGEEWKKLKRLDDLTDYKIQTAEDYNSTKKDLISLAKLVENVPLIRGVGYRGWLRFEFTTNKASLESHVYSRVRIIDALGGEHEVDTSEPRDTSEGELTHNPANVFKN